MFHANYLVFPVLLFEIHFYTEPNPYLGVDTVVVLDKNNSVFIVPQFKLTQHEIHNALPIDHPYDDIMLNFEATASMKDGRFALTRLVDSMCPFSLINKPEKIFNKSPDFFPLSSIALL